MSKSSIRRAIEKRWYSKAGVLLLLSPLEWVFNALTQLRKKYQQKKASEFSAPVIVVGNISVGGTGKTPTIIALVKFLQQRGLRPGVISRGYGRKNNQLVFAQYNNSVDDIGDEPALIYRATGCDIAVSSNRVEAAQALIRQFSCDLILADDGLQHYKLYRDLEIAVVDGHRGCGNGHMLPVGPLREPPERLATCDWVLVNDAAKNCENVHLLDGNIYHMAIRATGLTDITSGDLFALEKTQELSNIVALAGLGNPQKFFDTLKSIGLNFSTRIFPDHYDYSSEDLEVAPEQTLIMTEKDAVKCQSLLTDTAYCLNVEMNMSQEFLESFFSKVNRLIDRGKA